MRLQQNLIFGLTILLSIIAIFSAVNFSYKTVDDSSSLFNLLEQKQSTGDILGANSETKSDYFGCSEQKPVIGWINFHGKKIIKDTLSNNNTPSSCFKNINEANEAGFWKE